MKNKQITFRRMPWYYLKYATTVSFYKLNARGYQSVSSSAVQYSWNSVEICLRNTRVLVASVVILFVRDFGLIGQKWVCAALVMLLKDFGRNGIICISICVRSFFRLSRRPGGQCTTSWKVQEKVVSDVHICMYTYTQLDLQ